MAPKPIEAPALFSLLVFLGIHYLAGFALGLWLTRSAVAAIVLALIAPCLSLLGIALFSRPTVPMTEDSALDEA